MKPRHQVSRAAVDLIKRFEGYRSKAAQLPDGRWTIGYGHTLTAREGAQVSEQDAEALLLYDLISVAHAVNEQTFTPLTQNQFDALCAFAFNIGLDNFKRSSVLRRVNEGSLLQAACAMEMWRKADFEGERIVVDALVRRRSAEKTLFLTPAGGWVPAPSPIVRPKVDYDAVNFVPRQTPTALDAPMTGDKAFVRREGEEGVAAPVSGLATSAAMTAAAAVTSRLAEILPDPEPVSAAPPEPVQVAEAEPAPAEPAVESWQMAEAAPAPEAPSEPDSLAWSPAENGDDEADADAGSDEPMLVIEATPAQPTEEPAPDALIAPPPPVAAEVLPTETASYTPYPATPTLAVVNGEPAFNLTPAAETDPVAEPEQEPQRPAFALPEAANESEPGLFDVPPPMPEAYPEPAFEQPVEPVRTQAFMAEDQIRRLVEQDERTMAADFDGALTEAPMEQARFVGLPWFASAITGVAVAAGGAVWGFADATGEPSADLISWGLFIGGSGLAIFAGWRWLNALGVPRLDDEDEAIEFEMADPDSADQRN
jgi:lysozyme